MKENQAWNLFGTRGPRSWILHSRSLSSPHRNSTDFQWSDCESNTSICLEISSMHSQPWISMDAWISACAQLTVKSIATSQGALVNTAYYGPCSLIEEFMTAATELFSRKCLLQFEDPACRMVKYRVSQAIIWLAQLRRKWWANFLLLAKALDSESVLEVLSQERSSQSR